MVRPIKRSLMAIIALALSCCALGYNPIAHSRSNTFVAQKSAPFVGTFDVKKFGACWESCLPKGFSSGT